MMTELKRRAISEARALRQARARAVNTNFSAYAQAENKIKEDQLTMITKLPAVVLWIIAIVAQGLKAKYPEFSPVIDSILSFLGIGAATGLLFTRSVLH